MAADNTICKIITFRSDYVVWRLENKHKLNCSQVERIGKLQQLFEKELFVTKRISDGDNV